MSILDCIESLAEAAADQGIPSVVIAIRVESDAEVDELYVSMGEPRGVGARFERPHNDFCGGEDIGMWQRKAVTSVRGAVVVVTGPYRIQGRTKAA